MNKFKNIAIIFGLFALLFASCFEKDEPKEETRRTIIMYLISTNSLSTSIASDITEIEESIRLLNDMNNCRLLVYHVSYSQAPYLFEIKKVKGRIERVTIKTYTDDVRSTTIERMTEVITDAIKTAPAKEYGLVLGSHASGWASSLVARSNITPRDFGEDYSNTMKLDELAEAIPNNTFNFIYADACFMGGVEVAYELKDDAKYFIGSTTEIPKDGMDYANNISCFFADDLELSIVCDNTYQKYNQKTGSARTCTISLIDCSMLNDLALICMSMNAIGEGTMDYSILQVYKESSPYLFYDFKQYYNTFEPKADEDGAKLDALKAELNDMLNKTILYKAATPSIFNRLNIDSEKYSGLSTYVLGSTSPDGVNENYYKTLSWYQDVFK